MNNSLLELIAMFMLFVSITALYYVFILGPRDAVLYEIMECMEHDNSQEAYDNCHEKLRPSRASPS